MLVIVIPAKLCARRRTVVTGGTPIQMPETGDRRASGQGRVGLKEEDRPYLFCSLFSDCASVYRISLFLVAFCLQRIWGLMDSPRSADC